MNSFRVIRNSVLGWLCAVVFLAVITAPRVASAEDPATADRVQVELGVRYGFALESLEYNPWKLGWGGAVGYTREDAIYLGAAFDWFQGEELSFDADPTMYPDPPSIGGNYWQALVFGGYDIGVSETWIVRPKVGVGWSTSTIRDCNTLVGNTVECAKTIKSDTSIAPAFQLTYAGTVTVSLEARLVLLFDSVTIKTAAIGGLSVGF